MTNLAARTRATHLVGRAAAFAFVQHTRRARYTSADAAARLPWLAAAHAPVAAACRVAGAGGDANARIGRGSRIASAVHCAAVTAEIVVDERTIEFERAGISDSRAEVARVAVDGAVELAQSAA